MTDTTERFSNRVDDYVRYRPGYPATVIPILEREVGLRPDWRIADVGSGTGISSQLFLEHGNAVVGVEPNGEMREAAERLLGRWPRFRSVAGRAEATGLPDQSADLVVAAQAFHWFDLPAARSEFKRILERPAWVAVLWNTRSHDASPFMQAYEALMGRFGTDYQQVRHDRLQPDRLEEFFSSGFSRTILHNHQLFDLEGLRGRSRSSSYVPAPGHPEFDAMLEQLRELFDAHEQDGRVRFEYALEIYTGRLDQDGVG